MRKIFKTVEDAKDFEKVLLPYLRRGARNVQSCFINNIYVKVELQDDISDEYRTEIEQIFKR